jgi:hypothetical protein
MAYWQIKPASKSHGAFIWGDAAADSIAWAVDEVIEDFEQQFGRPPSKQEILAAVKIHLSIREELPNYPKKDNQCRKHLSKGKSNEIH